MKLSIVAPKINLETGGGSHWSLYLACRGLRELDVEVEIYSLNPTSVVSTAEIRALGVTLSDLDGRGSAKVVETLGGIKANAILVYGPLPIAYELKRRFPEQRVLAYFNALSGFCTNLMEQQAGCWLTCSHLDRVRHHRDGAREKIAYLVHGRHRVRYLRQGFRSLDGCIFASPPLREAYRIYGLSPDRCSVVPDCIDVEQIGRWAAPPHPDGGEVNILYVGTLAEYKGARLLFEALRRLRRPWRVWVFGDGPDRPRVLAFQEEFKEQVVYRGHVHNRVLFRELSARPFVLVHPCLWFDACPRSILEAMALGIPVIVPDVGGPAWIVRHGMNGLHYRHRDPDDLARSIEWAADHPEALQTLGAAGRERAREFDYRSVTHLWLDTLGHLSADGMGKSRSSSRAHAPPQSINNESGQAR